MPVPRGALRRLSALAVAASLLAMPGTASADRPIQFTDDSVGFDCFITDEGVTTFVTSYVATDFAHAFVDVSIELGEEPFFETLLFGFTDEVQVVDDGTNVTMSATIPLFVPSEEPPDPEEPGEPGEPVGEATLEALLTPDGPPITLTPTREGNRQIRSEGTIQPMAVSGTLTMPDGTIELGEPDCHGQRSNIEVWETNPRAFVDHNSGIFVGCEWQTDDGVAFFYAESGTFGTFADASLLEFEEGEPEPISGLETDPEATASVSLSTSALSATIPMLTFPDGDPAGSAVANATLTSAGPAERFEIVSQSFRVKIRATPLAVDGTLTFPTGETFAFADGSCFSADFRDQFKSNPAQGPKPKGRAPANDTPDGAIPLRPGSRLNTQTGGAAFEPEAEASCAPMGATVWYRIQGTGGPITVDTAGSGFDTVAAVYTTDGASFEELACVDDVPTGTIGFSWQASVTWDSIAGQTYYVQIGGWGGEFGRLRVTVN